MCPNALSAGQRWLPAWNEWRRANAAVEIDLRGVDLQSKNLRGADASPKTSSGYVLIFHKPLSNFAKPGLEILPLETVWKQQELGPYP